MVSYTIYEMCLISKWNALVKRSRDCNFELSLSIKDIKTLLEQQNYRCALSNRRIGFADDVDGSDTASVDRIDSNFGYVGGNIQWTHKAFNRLKNSLKEEVFVEMCREVVDTATGEIYMQEIESTRVVIDMTSSIGRLISKSIFDGQPIPLDIGTFTQIVNYAATLPQPISAVCDVYPSVSDELLRSRNPDNRPFNDRSIRGLASDINLGRYELNGETIKISREGYVNDGQDRLQASILADRPIRTVVVFGLLRDTRSTVDAGRKRTTGNVLAMAGYSDANNLAACARIVMCYETFGKIDSSPHHSFAGSDILDYLKDHPELQESSVIGSRVHATNPALPPSVIRGLHYICSKISRRDADFFFSRLADGVDLRADSPILKLRHVLNNATTDSHQKRLKTEWLAAIVGKAWNAHRDGRVIQTLRYSYAKRGLDNAPELFPAFR